MTMACPVGLSGLSIRILLTRGLVVHPGRLIDTGSDEVKSKGLHQLIEPGCEKATQNGSNPVDPVIRGKVPIDDVRLDIRNVSFKSCPWSV